MQDLAFILTPASEAPAWVAVDLPLAEATRPVPDRVHQESHRPHEGNMSDAAERLGLHRSNLYRKMRQLGMAVE